MCVWNFLAKGSTACIGVRYGGQCGRSYVLRVSSAAELLRKFFLASWTPLPAPARDTEMIVIKCIAKCKEKGRMFAMMEGAT